MELCYVGSCKYRPFILFMPYKDTLDKLENTNYPMIFDQNEKKYVLRLDLPKGEYRYKIIVDGKTWIDYDKEVILYFSIQCFQSKKGE